MTEARTGCTGNAEPCASTLNLASVIWSVMDRLHAAEFMEQLLAAHGAEDAFAPAPEDVDEPAPGKPAA